MTYSVKIRKVKVSRDISRPFKYVYSSWTGDGRTKRRQIILVLILISCNNGLCYSNIVIGD
uniref:Putative ovule protein n=1 Tax=Solanum chacoense TaxID=4108 RepID=A0A0V0HV37_SOLCH